MTSTDTPRPALEQWTPPGPVRGRPVRPIAVLVVFCLGLFMTLLDLTIVNIAIPDMVTSLGSSLDQVLWVLNGYSIGYAVLLITAGRLGDVVGPRTMFLIGMAVFTLASLGSGLAGSVGALIAFRAVQGLGAALLAPQGLPLFSSVLPPDRRGGAFAALGAMSGLAVLAGPTLGGLIVTHWGWRWIFYVNLPIGVLTMTLCALLVPDLRPGVRHRLDTTGVALLTVGLFAVVFGLIEGERYHWGVVGHGVTIWEIIAAGVLVLIGFGWSQARSRRSEPLLPFELFRYRNFTLMTVVLGAMGFAIVGFYLPLTIYLQSVLGLSAVAAGVAIAPQPLAMMVSSMVSGALSDRVNGKLFLVPGLLVFAAGTGWLAWIIQPGTSRWELVAPLVVAGLGMGCVWVPVFGLATRDLPVRLTGVASGVIDTLQEVGSVVATAVIGAVLQSRLADALTEQATQRAGQLPPGARAGFVAGFRDAGSGLQVGAGQSGAPVASAPDPQLAARIAELAHQVFQHAFVAAMRPTMVVPLVVVVLAAGAALAVRRNADHLT